MTQAEKIMFSRSRSMRAFSDVNVWRRDHAAFFALVWRKDRPRTEESCVR